MNGDLLEQIRADGRDAANEAPPPTDEQLRRIADVIHAPRERQLERRAS